jgi:hypothetical protein
VGRQHAEGRGYGLVVFAAILLAVIGCFNLLYGIAAIVNSHVFRRQRALRVRQLAGVGLDHADHRGDAVAGGGRGPFRQPGGLLPARSGR